MPRTWHPEEIKAEVRKRDITLSRLALDHDLPADACRKALRARLPKAERVIAAFIDVPLHELWPERWDADGTRRDNRKGHLSRRWSGRNVRSSWAA